MMSNSQKHIKRKYLNLRKAVKTKTKNTKNYIKC